MTLPRRLSAHSKSPDYNLDALKRVDKVFVNGVHVPNAWFYDMDQRVVVPRLKGYNGTAIRGEVTVTEKP